MSIYWKQSLWLGGVYWVISLILSLINTPTSYFMDFACSLLLTLFLIPMNFLVPIKWIDKAITKMPVTATFLVSVGWVPYFVVLVFAISAMFAVVALVGGFMTVEEIIINLINPLSIVAVVRVMMTALAIIIASFYVLLYKKSIAGCLDKRFNLVGGNSCEMKIVEPAVAEHAKKMYACKREATARKAEKKKVAKKSTDKKTTTKIVKKEKKETAKKEDNKKAVVKKMQKNKKSVKSA